MRSCIFVETFWFDNNSVKSWPFDNKPNIDPIFTLGLACENSTLTSSRQCCEPARRLQTIFCASKPSFTGFLNVGIVGIFDKVGAFIFSFFPIIDEDKLSFVLDDDLRGILALLWIEFVLCKAALLIEICGSAPAWNVLVGGCLIIILLFRSGTLLLFFITLWFKFGGDNVECVSSILFKVGNWYFGNKRSNSCWYYKIISEK